MNSRFAAFVAAALVSAGCAENAPAPPRTEVVPPSASSRPPPVEDGGARVRKPSYPVVATPPGLRPFPLGDTAPAFAGYLNGMHNRIHPLFADGYIAKLDATPPSDPINDPRVSTSLEIVVDRSGVVDHVRVTRSSGFPEFDAASVDSILHAGPFDPPPAETLSADGKIYVGWIFKRDLFFVCSTRFAQPYLFR